MTPIATVACLAFMALLLQRSSRWEPKPSWGLWAATIFIGEMLSRPTSYWFEVGGGAGGDLNASLDGDPLERAVMTTMIVVGLVVLWRRRHNLGSIFASYPIVWLFYGYFVLSIVWAPFPFVAFKRLIRELGTVVSILIILGEPNPIDAVRRVFVRCVVVLVPVSVLLIKYYPQIGRYYSRWPPWGAAYSGVTTNKNSLGLVAMLGALFLLWHMIELWKGGRTRWQRLASIGPEAGVFLMCLWILSIADSQTSVVSFTVGLVVFLACRTVLAGTPVKVTVGAVVVIGVVGAVGVQTSAMRGVVATSVGRNESLTTRTDIWAAAVALPTNPVVGAGFSSVWLTPYGLALKEVFGPSLTHSHNGYLETYLNGGSIGVALLIGVLLSAALQAARHLRAKTSAGAFYVALVLAGVVYNFTEVTFNNGNGLGLLLWLIAMSNPEVLFDAARVDQLWKGAPPASNALAPARPSVGRGLSSARHAYSQRAIPRRSS